MNNNNNSINQVSYLRLSRRFPASNITDLALEVDRAYIDVANAVNNRIISSFPNNKPMITGETWYSNGQIKTQQTLRQIYYFSSLAAIPHGLDINTINLFTKCKGFYTDGTNYYGAMFTSNVAIAGQITFYVTPTNIIFLNGGGTPTVDNGIIVLEWLSRN